MSTKKTVVDLLAFVEREGMVLESARRPPVPNLVEYIASERVEGSWWGHPKGHEIYARAFALSNTDLRRSVALTYSA